MCAAYCIEHYDTGLLQQIMQQVAQQGEVLRQLVRNVEEVKMQVSVQTNILRTVAAQREDAANDSVAMPDTVHLPFDSIDEVKSADSVFADAALKRKLVSNQNVLIFISAPTQKLATDAIGISVIYCR